MNFNFIKRPSKHAQQTIPDLRIFRIYDIIAINMLKEFKE
jgi:hypothetical protein